jgi:comEA protein
LKKAVVFLLIGLTVFACGTVIGVLVGRSQSHHAVTVQYLSASDSPDAQAPTNSHRFLVNINTASVELLDTLPGIGPVLAKRIVDYREANGNFAAKSDLMNVEGIGYDTMFKIIDLITVEVENENTSSG